MLCSGLVLVLSLSLHAADKKDNPKGGEPVDAAKQLQPGDVSGVVVSNDGKTLVLRMEFESLQPNGTGGKNNNNNQQLQRQYRELQQAEQQLARAKNPQQAMQAYRKLMQEMQQTAAARQPKGNQQNPFKVVKSHVDYEIELDDSVVFRSTTVPTAFDDMGNIKKYTAEELKQLRGDGKLAGYQSSAEKAGKDAEVRVHLSKNKETENKLRATVVYITKEGTNPTPKGKKK